MSFPIVANAGASGSTSICAVLLDEERHEIADLRAPRQIDIAEAEGEQKIFEIHVEREWLTQDLCATGVELWNVLEHAQKLRKDAHLSLGSVGVGVRFPLRPLEVVTYHASEVSARVYARLSMGERDALLVDATMTLSDAEEVAGIIDRSGRRLRKIFITHSEPDKYLGLARLAERFPEARVVATPAVVADIVERGPGYLERLRARWGDRIASTLVIPEPFGAEEFEREGEPVPVLRFTGGESGNAAAPTPSAVP